ncbi:MAG: hypothetical protein JNK15_01040 [Planctomycetes bacterium]|nr:hypothetical protein [Planctomycetota bacterium]
MNARASSLAFLLVSLGALPAQLIPKNLDAKRPAVPNRLAGTWLGKAQEQLEGGKTLDYDLSLQFAGADDALRLEVRATVPVDTGQGKVTVSVFATYRGTFRAPDLRMQSESIEVKVVETGERIPSEPQTVEGKLADGVLTGRVGSDGDGWTRFTAKAKGDDGKPVVVANTELRGGWSGTARENGPDGKELRYPIRVVFGGDGDRLTAEVSADMRYPVQGGSTPVEYRATFRGSRRGDELQMTSDKVTIRLVEMGRTESGPRQEFTGKLQDGVLKGRVGGSEGEVTTLELRADASDSVVDDRGPIGEDSVPRPGPIGDPVRGQRRELPQSYRTVLLEPREVRDAGAGNVVSHTLRLPRGWNLGAAPEWRAFPDSFVNLVGEVRGNEGEAITFAADHVFTYSGTQSQFGNQSTEQQAWTRDGQALRRPPSGPGAVAVELLVPFLRPGASDVQLVDAGRDEAREAAFRAMCAPTIEAFEANCRNLSLNGGVQSQSKPWLASERSRVRYRDGGRTWEEEFECSLVGMHGSSQIEGMSSDNGMWIVCQVRSFRAPLGELDARLPLLVVVADSVRETPRWSLGVSAIKLELAKARTQQLRLETAEMQRRLAERAAANTQVRDAEMATWRSQQDAGDRMHEANVQALTETQKFRDGDGTTHTVTNHYDRAFRNPDNTILLTNDPNYRPAGDPNVNQVRWEELQRVDPFRSGR